MLDAGTVASPMLNLSGAADRHAVLSPFQAAGLKGYLRGYLGISADTEEPPNTTGLTHGRTLIYTSLLQAGVSRLELSFPDDSEMPTEGYLKERVTVHKGPEVAEIFMVVYAAFGKHLPDFAERPEWKAARMLALYVIDLLFALSRGKSMVDVLGLPDVDAVTRTLPALLAVPLRNLFASMTRVAPQVVAPRVLVDVERLALFQEILSAAAFRDYERAHSTLERGGTRPARELALIQQTAERLCARTKRVLRLRKIAASLLPASSGIVEQSLGALPGKLAGVAVAAAEPWLKSRRQMIVYDMASSMSAILTGR